MEKWTFYILYLCFSLSSLQDTNNFNFINITCCSSEHLAAWDSSTSVYILFLVVTLSFFAFKNSQIPEGLKDFKAEGVASTRIFIFFIALEVGASFVFIFIDENLQHYKILVWLLATEAILIPTIIITIIFLPKVCSKVYVMC